MAGVVRFELTQLAGQSRLPYRLATPLWEISLLYNGEICKYYILFGGFFGISIIPIDRKFFSV